MRSRANCLTAAALFVGNCFAGSFLAPEQWQRILSSAGHAPASSDKQANILVADPNAPADPVWQTRVSRGAALILEGGSPLAVSFGFVPGSTTIPAIHAVDEHNPTLPIVWEKSIAVPRFELPPAAHVFARERWTGAPLIAGLHFGSGAVLWIATNPGTSGYERYPYLMQALADLGFGPSFRSSRLWAFFDYSYRTRANPDYLAAKWRAAGIGALHVASWHFYDADAARDEYLRLLIQACHRQGILIYAWVELPHVSEQFWNAHPEWREKTALLQDAQLDWRKLMNLQNPDCVKAIRIGLRAMMQRFDWDGINLAELYFESLEGAGNPGRFTPMNEDVRAAFRAEAGWDPLDLWKQRTDAASLRRFLDYRAGLVRKMQEDWLAVGLEFRSFRPGLDIVLTHVDDRFDTGMKDAIGADASRVLPLLDTNAFSFLIEDPATVWNLGPERYPEIARRYAPLTTHTEKLAIDINIVDRYQDVYPTKQQTGTELFELVHMAASAFPRVALYFENSILKPDMSLLAASSATVKSFAQDAAGISIDSPDGVELIWNRGGALVDGHPWPLISKTAIILPAGVHRIATAPARTTLAITDLNGTLLSADGTDTQASFRYRSDSRAIATFNHKPAALDLDGQTFAFTCAASSAPETSDCAVLLPRGEHSITAR